MPHQVIQDEQNTDRWKEAVELVCRWVEIPILPPAPLTHLRWSFGTLLENDLQFLFEPRMQDRIRALINRLSSQFSGRRPRTRSEIWRFCHECIDGPDRLAPLLGAMTCQEAGWSDRVPLHLRTRPGSPTVRQASMPARSAFFFLQIRIVALFDHAFFVLAEGDPRLAPGATLLPGVACFM